MIRSSLRHWLNRRAHSSHRGRRWAGPPNRRSRLHLETLEGRCLPSTVTNLSDHDPGSLRDAIATTPAGGTVDFQAGLSGTITLTTGELAVNKDLTIAGPGADVVTVSGNHASRVFDIGATFTVDIAGLTIADGSLTNAGYGGGIYNQGALSVTDCTLSGNSAPYSGGGIGNVGTLTVTDCTLSGNSAPYSGGGIGNIGTLTVTDCTLSGNSAGFDGGVYNVGTLTVTDCTLSGNSAGYSGGGIANYGTTATSKNTILAGNTAPSSPDMSGLLNSQGHNLIGDGTGGSGYDPTDLVGMSDNPINPKLGPLQDNGGPTPTMAPLPSSPAIDAGDPTDVPPTDQRGLPRVLDGTIDIGAVELRVFHVTSTADTGPGSLRQAILDANATPGTNGIAFTLGVGGVHTIAPTSPLPAVTNPVEIDGATQPGYAGTPLIELAGESAGHGADGLTLASTGSTVTGLVVGGFGGAGVSISGNGNRVVGNFLGTDATGTMVHRNRTGVAIVYIGSDNLIGGTAPGAGNLISGNLQDGVGLYGGTGNQIQGNFIGTDASGTQALPNGYGVELFSGSANTLGGGTVPGAGNLISGNRYDGIGIYSDGNVIQANRIGTDVTGTHPLGNGSDGVAILAFQYGYNNVIGGTGAGAANTIAYNGGYGVRITTGTGEAIHQNAIFANAHGGIALLDGGNQNAPAPQLTSAVSASGTTTISGTVTGSPGQTLTVEFFDNPVRTRQGESFLGSTTVAVGADGQGSFEFQVSGGVNVGDFVTATATDDAGNTSRFSRPVEVTGTDTVGGSLNGAAVLPGLATAPPATASSADDPAATPATPLPGDVGTNPTVPSGAAVLPVRLATAPHAADAMFAAWDTVTDGLALVWE
jgi:hypothetical protein